MPHSYYGDGGFIATVEYSGGDYIVSDIPADQVNDLTFMQSARSVEVTWEAYTVDGTDDSSDEPVLSGELNGFNVDNIYEVIPSSGGDRLFYDGTADRSYDGFDGNDTLLFRNGYVLDDDDVRQGENLDCGSQAGSGCEQYRGFRYGQ